MVDLARKVSKGEANVDDLFRGSSDNVKAEVKESYGYDKYTFSEEDLPGYEEEVEATKKVVSKSPSRAMAGTSPPRSPQVLLPGPSKRALEILGKSHHR